MAGTSRTKSVRVGTISGALAIGATLISITGVLACTDIMGVMTLTPDSAPAGTVIHSSVTGLKPYPARYNIYFGGECMTFTGKLLKIVTPNAAGAWTNVKLKIPLSAKPGTYSLCGVESYPTPGQSATSHNSFTVV